MYRGKLKESNLTDPGLSFCQGRSLKDSGTMKFNAEKTEMQWSLVHDPGSQRSKQQCENKLAFWKTIRSIGTINWKGCLVSETAYPSNAPWTWPHRPLRSASWIDGCSIFLEKNIQLVLKVFMSAPHPPICIFPIRSNQKRLHVISNILVVLNLLPREFLQAFSPLPFRICFSYCVQIQNSSTSKPR